MSPSTTTAGLIKNRRLPTPPSVQHSSRTPTPSYPTKLPGIVCTNHGKHGKTEASHAQPIFPCDELYEEDTRFSENFLGSPDLHLNTNTPAMLRARSHSVSINCSTSASRSPSAPNAPISCPSKFAPTWTLPEDTGLITDANFVACRHTRSDPCLVHAGIGPCDCEAVQRPTMSQDAAWTVLSRRFKAVYDAGRNELPPLRVPCAPLAIGAPHARRSASSPLGDSRAPIPAAAAARRSCPTRLVSLPPSRGHQPSVLAVPSRVVKESVVAHAHAAVARDARRARDARDVIERRRANPYTTERVPGAHRPRFGGLALGV